MEEQSTTSPPQLDSVLHSPSLENESGSASSPAISRNPSIHARSSTIEDVEYLGRSRPPVHRLYSSRRLDEPDVLWTANVFDAADESGFKSGTEPAAVYHDGRPLKLSSRTQHMETTLDEKHKPVNVELDEDAYFPNWSGHVFEIICRAMAIFPSKTIYAENRTPRIENIIPSQPQILELSKMSRSGISIKSPILYRKLSEIIGYYPSFHKKPAGDLLNLNRNTAKELTTEFILYEPYGALMHHFLEIEALTKTKTLYDSEIEAKAESKEDEYQRLQTKHLRLLYNFLKPRFDTHILSAEKSLKQDSPCVTFNMLWYLFKPGTDVYLKTEGSIHACVVADIYSNLDNDDNPRARSSTQSLQTTLEYWVLDLWCLDTNGTRIGRTQTTCRILAYTGYKEVVTLAACPVSIWDAYDKGERRLSIMRRSRILLKALQQGYLLAHYDGPVNGQRQYSGTMVIDHQRGLLNSRSSAPPLGRVRDPGKDFDEYDNIRVNDDASFGGGDDIIEVIEEASSGYTTASEGSDRRTRQTRRAGSIVRRRSRSLPLRRRARERIVVEERIDHGSYQLPNATGENKLETTQESTKDPKGDLTDHQLLLMWPLTHAFALKTKQWVVIRTDFVHEIEPSEEGMLNLVLGKDETDTIRGLARRQNSKNDVWAADFIQGKGTGQIILLHGPPGVGKTYTVEAIAEWLHRPLLALTVADIGTVETRVERELIRWFTLAEAWNAVLLVDEADIFLERRQNRDLARNGLVSAFLRRMEYFKGLLFLTTNRVGQIDDAFISRVHVAIGYKPLSGDDRQKVWKGFFAKLAKEQAGKIRVASGAKKWVLERAASGQSQLNGRDIRNALQTAITLAEAEAEEDPDVDLDKGDVVVVEQSHFQRVLDISHRFHEYIKSIRREDEPKRAAGRLDRNDYWLENKEPA